MRIAGVVSPAAEPAAEPAPRGSRRRGHQAGLSASTAARAAALSVNQVASIVRVVGPLGRQRLLGEDRVHRALRLAGAAVDAFVRVDEQLAIGAFLEMDAVDRADRDARHVEHVDARLGDHVGHSSFLLEAGGKRGRTLGRAGARERTTADPQGVPRRRATDRHPPQRPGICIPFAQWPGMWQPTI